MTSEERELKRQERERRRREIEHKRAIENAAKEAGRGPLDVPFLLLTLLLTGVGLIMLFSASFPSAYYESGNPAYYFIRQSIFAALGITAMFLIGRINYERYRAVSKMILFISIVLLIAVLIPGVGTGRVTHGAQRWIRAIGPIPKFQPSEVAKMGIILYFADSISKKKERMHTIRYGILPYAFILGIIAVLMMLEPHLSGTILIVGIGAMMMFVGGIQLYWLVIGAGGAGMVAYAFMTGIIKYNSSRIAIWLDPLNPEFMQGKGYQTRQSLLAIGSGGLLGVGLGRSRQKFLYLPEEHNDFIFSIVCEELGLIGATLIMALFALLIIRGYWIALHARDRFGALLAVGVTTQIALQVFLNIAVVSNLIPNTGISLPFFSYGGTALAIQLAEMGVVLSVSRQMPPS
ncbi:MAG: putative lipid II flippase FtsW [Ruminococcaceae bacterium]|nr:putative lipid II flippase FtsW [Oscillospiraceae bacterium]